MRFCLHCGKLTSDDAKFCQHCGKMIVRPAVIGDVPAAPPKGSLGFYIAVAAALILIAMVYRAPDSSFPSTETLQPSDKAATAKDEDAQSNADQEEDADINGATEMSLSLAAYRSAKANQVYAYARCKIEATDRAKYDYKTDWIPNYTWKANVNGILTIVGRDVRLQNAFGAYGYVTYICEWDPKSKGVVSLNIAQD